MLQSKLVPVDPGDIRLNSPLARSIYDPYGRLLLRRGLIVDTPRLLEHLLSVGMKEATEITHVSNTANVVHVEAPFEQMENVAARLSRFYQSVRERPDHPEFIAGIGKIADALLACCAADGDAAFAMPHLDRHHNYETVHHLMAGVICARIAIAQQWGDEQRRTAVSAVLTQDIALLPHRRLLDADVKLNAGQRLIVNRHPGEGARWLERAGVRDEPWLRCVRQHHRGCNGGGYPADDAEPLCVEARVAALADTFSAMLRPRPYRGRIPATAALADLYANTDGRYDGGFVNCLIREVGIFPPGSLVTLANGECGIVVRNRPGQLYTPEVWVLATAKGHQLMHPSLRDVADPDCAIVSLGRPENCHSVMRSVAALWDDARSQPAAPASAPDADHAPPVPPPRAPQVAHATF